MKKLLLLKIYLCCLLHGITFHVGASTSITTPAVSGHWTMAGSPYNIYNDISVLPNTTLKIDPGVQVVFHGLYRLNVQGILQAVGNASQRISFKAYDTTGWCDNSSPLGGWHGLQFNMFASTGADSSAMEYCNITDVKYGMVSTSYPGYYTGCFFIDSNRHMVVKNCDFSHNMSGDNYAPPCIFLLGGQTLDSCNIYNNRGSIIVGLALNTPELNHCSIHHNITTSNTIAIKMQYSGIYHFSNILNCDIYENETGLYGSQVYVSAGHAVIRGCKIHHNINPDEGAIYCVCGMVEIADNLICNNQQSVPGPCGAAIGGGAMHLCNSVSPSLADSISYFVHDNVIANNFSSSGMGCGIYVFHANVWIMNNTIINNICSGLGAAIGLTNLGSSAHIKNNILRNNQCTACAGYMSEIFVVNCDSVEFENNWMEHPYSETITVGSFFPIGDTATNIIGSDPHLANPTDSANCTGPALTANFALTAASASCINKGDNTGCMPAVTDYAGNPRIFAGTIDIGAYEYPTALNVRNVITNAPQMLVYPNPASCKISISLPVATGILKITDVAGRVVATADVTAQTVSIDINNYAKGLYIVEWVSGNGPSQIKKLIVE